MKLPAPDDMVHAAAVFDAACGHGALAAATGLRVSAVMPWFSRGGWVNLPMMRDAIERSGRRIARQLEAWHHEAEPAVSLLQWTGPWMATSCPPTVRCRYRHWIATLGPQCWDANADEWLHQEEWEALIVPALLPPRATGWEVFRTLVIDHAN